MKRLLPDVVMVKTYVMGLSPDEVKANKKARYTFEIEQFNRTHSTKRIRYSEVGYLSNVVHNLKQYIDGTLNVKEVKATVINIEY